MNNNDLVKEFEKNLIRINVNNENINIASKLADISYKLDKLSKKLKNNINDPNIIILDRPAGHIRPIHNNTHIHFNNSLRSYW